MENETIHISKESMDTFNHDKNVVNMTIKEMYERHLECPINYGADLNSDTMYDNLFDDGQYVENRVNGKYVTLGFIGGVPARCEYELGHNTMWIFPILKKKESDYSSWKYIISERLGDEAIFAKVCNVGGGIRHVYFFYRSAD